MSSHACSSPDRPVSGPTIPSRFAMHRLLLTTAIAWIASGGLNYSPTDPVDVDVAAAPPPTISGRYDVQGFTRTPGTAVERRLEGTVILVQQGDGYTATYELSTTWPASGADADADVVGVGEGVIEGGRLEGEARTQLVISSVPGVDAGFAFVPRVVTARIVSNSVAKVSSDGSIEIELENRGAEGESYAPTRTKLVGRRVDLTP